MIGMYIHVPFCDKKCYYCDFYSIKTPKNTKIIHQFIESLIYEINNFTLAENIKITTLYFGGGTPSVLNINQLTLIFEALKLKFDFNELDEITFEINPEHITNEYLYGLEQLGVNRLSVGVQSLNNKHLRFLGRNHNKELIYKAFEIINSFSIKNINADLIFGFDGLELNDIYNIVNFFIEQSIAHISTYHLSYEKGTLFYKYLNNQTIKEVSDNKSYEQYQYIRKVLTDFKYEHYEISNYALKGFRSKHNSNYWLGMDYIGFGPSAHSFINNTRYWNQSNLFKYLKIKHTDIKNSEILTTIDEFNEYLMLRLRTNRGLSIKEMSKCFSTDFVNHFLNKSQSFIENKQIIFKEDYYKIAPEHWLISDAIISDLFIVE